MAAHAKPQAKPEPKGPTGTKGPEATSAIDHESMHQDQPHSSETHGTMPHPSTGVHAVHIHHMGGGSHVTHTHHDGGQIETQNHASADEAHAHAQASLPAGEGDQKEPNGEDYMANMGMSALGGDDDGDEG